MFLKSKSVQNLGLSIISGLLLCAAWSGLPIAWVMFIAFVPLLFILQNLLNSDKKYKGSKFFAFSFLSFFIWNLITTWWVSIATIEGGVAAVVCYSIFMALTMRLIFVVFRKLGKKYGYIAFIVFWISYEYIFMNSDVAWPWLILGNAFAYNISLIQWYEFVGHIGGTAWILLINVLIFELIQRIFNKNIKKKILMPILIVCTLIFIPIIYSLIRYYTYKEVGKDINVVVIQPNIDPYNEKFDGLPIEEQLNIILEEANKLADSDVDYFIAPETAIPKDIYEDEITSNSQIIYLKSFLEYYPKAKILIGVATRSFYPNGEGKTETARKFKNSEDYFDIHNSSIQLDTSPEIQIYHKSRLVPGAEIMPFPKIFGFLQDIFFDFGGTTGTTAGQKDREVFLDKTNGTNVAVPICYESVFGEFVAEFSKNGANFIAIITNDGWWGDTQGYRQHENYAKLRAVESRKAIARSANTGISCFINQRGDVEQTLAWNKKGALKQIIKANDKITFYAKYGDFIARTALFVSALILIMILYSVSLKKLKKGTK